MCERRAAAASDCARWQMNTVAGVSWTAGTVYSTVGMWLHTGAGADAFVASSASGALTGGNLRLYGSTIASGAGVVLGANTLLSGSLHVVGGSTTMSGGFAFVGGDAVVDAGASLAITGDGACTMSGPTVMTVDGSVSAAASCTVDVPLQGTGAWVQSAGRAVFSRDVQVAVSVSGFGSAVSTAPGASVTIGGLVTVGVGASFRVGRSGEASCRQRRT